MADAIVFLVRHGRTPLNAAGVLRGRIDTPLDHVGRAEARALGDVFHGVSISGVVTSPLRASPRHGHGHYQHHWRACRHR